MSATGQTIQQTETLTVLHVDDEPQFLDLASEMLERASDSIKVLTAPNTTDGLSTLRDRSVDCVVSDYNMPKTDGLEFLEQVRLEYPRLPFILFTGKGSEEIASEAISRGVTDYLQKGPGTDTYTVLANRIEHAVAQFRSRKTLEEREESLSRAQRIADLGNWDWDIEGGHLYWSEQVYRIFGVEPHAFESTYDAFMEFVHTDDRDRVQEAVDAALEEDVSYSIDHRIVRADGEERVVHEQAEVIRDNDGNPVAMNGTVQDITERVRQQRDLDAFREAVEHSGHSIYWTDSEGTIQYVNPTFEAVTGYSREEAIGQTPRILKSGVHGDAYYDEMWETITDGQVWQAEIVNERKDSEQYVVEQTIAPITDENGEVERFVAVNSEITDLMEQEAALERERDRFAALFEAIPEPAVHLKFDDGQAVVKDANEAFTETFGYSLPAARGQPINELIVPPEDREEAESLDAMAREGRPVTRQVRREAADGIREFLVRSAPFGGGAGPMEQFGVYVDISTQKEYEREIEQRMQRLDEFSSIIAHDLRSPLNVVQGRIELARSDCDSDDLDAADNALDRMESIIVNTLELARQGKVVGETRSLDLTAFVPDCWETVDTGRAELRSADPPTIEANPDRLKHLLENMFRNAIEHGSDDVTVTVGTLPEGFYVADDGTGIPEADRDSVFDLSYSSTDSTGIGLTLVKRIVDAHGWDISVSQSDTGGARFEITGVETRG